ncbi:MAG: hypothetical protein JSU74_00180 [Candidatus Zixiibacteriota bacterium]|nr:MAG: hypothetical protein JSU74_00180 [candidate division Zixibacteria bacterium]
MYRFRIAIVLIVSLTLGLSDMVQGSEHDPPVSEEHRSAVVKRIRLGFVPFVSLGVVTGEAADQIERYSTDFSDKQLYGGGISFCFSPEPTIDLTANVEYGVNRVSYFDAGDATGWCYSLGFIGFLSDQRRTAPYIQLGLGFVTGKCPDYRSTIDLKLGTHLFYRAEFGLRIPLSTKLCIRSELLYRYALSEGYEIEQLNGAEIPFNASSLGLELGVELPLLSR